MWYYGEIDGHRWEAKIYDRPSMCGIGDGRISKLIVYDENGDDLVVYDRGWSLGQEKKELWEPIVEQYQ